MFHNITVFTVVCVLYLRSNKRSLAELDFFMKHKKNLTTPKPGTVVYITLFMFTLQIYHYISSYILNI